MVGIARRFLSHRVVKCHEVKLQNVLVALTSSARLGFKDNQRRMCGGIQCYNYITGEADSLVKGWAKK